MKKEKPRTEELEKLLAKGYTKTSRPLPDFFIEFGLGSHRIIYDKVLDKVAMEYYVQPNPNKEDGTTNRRT